MPAVFSVSIVAMMLRSEKIELAIYKAVNRGPGPVTLMTTMPMLSQLTGEDDHAAIADRLKALAADNRIQLCKYSGGQQWPRLPSQSDATFFFTGEFGVEIVPQGRKYFEELEQRAEQEAKKPLVVPAAPREPLIFVSCGQSTPAERKLGQEIAKLVEQKTGCRAYFAENQNTLEGVTENILKRLHTAAGFIAIMHPRGDVSNSATGRTWVRGSVWVEQEIAIAAFIAQALQQPMRVRAYVHESIFREGLRSQLHLNPKSFVEDSEIVNDLTVELPSWRNLVQPQHSEFDLAHKQLAEEKVSKLSPTSKKLVIYLLHHGKTELNTLATKSQPTDQFGEAIQQASREGLVKDSVTGNPARPGTLYYWEINPTFEAALRDLLGKTGMSIDR
jgi:hypothetical protein